MNIANTKHYTVLGAGAWGTALANLLCTNNKNTVVFTRNEQIVHEINTSHTNNTYLKNITLQPDLKASFNLVKILQAAHKIVLAIPAQQLRNFLKENKQHISSDAILILCAKGIEQTTGLFMSQVVQEFLPNNKLAIISGPSFAEDVALNLPTAVTLACEDIDLAQALSLDFSSSKFRCYSNDDIIGVQIGGALKNVFAIASGALAGLGFGESAKAALITRAFAEMRRVGVRLGGRLETFSGLSGLGDLMLSCNSNKSRNFTFGYSISTNINFEEKLTEGYYTADISAKICQELNIDAPLILATYQLIYDKNNIKDIYNELLNRPLKIED